MNPESIQKIIDSLEKNGGAALDALASYKVATAYGDLVVTAIAPFVLIVLVYYFSKFTKKFDEADFDSATEKLYIAGMISTGVIGGLTAIVTVACFLLLPNTIAAIKNPKGAAIYSLLKKD